MTVKEQFSSIQKNYLLTLADQLFAMLVPFITAPYTARVLGAEAIGIYSYTYSIYFLFAILGTVGTGYYASRQIAYTRDDSQKCSRTFWEIFLLRNIFLAAMTLIYLVAIIPHSAFRTVALLQVINFAAMAMDVSWFFEGREFFNKIVLRNISIKIMAIAALFILIRKPSDLPLYTACFALGSVIGNASLLPYLKNLLTPIPLRGLRLLPHLKGALPLLLPQLALTMQLYINRIMVGSLTKNQAEVGFYVQAQTVVSAALVLITSLSFVKAPRIANSFQNNRNEFIAQTLENSMRFLWLFGFLLVAGLAGTAQSFVPWFLGNDFYRVSAIIIWLCPVLLFSGLASVLGEQYLLPTGKNRQWTGALVLNVLLNVGMNFALIPAFGAVGSAISVDVSGLACALLMLYFVRKHIHFKLLLPIRHLLCAIAALGVMLGIHWLWRASSALETLAIIVAGFAVYVFPLWFCKDQFFIQGVDMVWEKMNGIKLGR